MKQVLLALALPMLFVNIVNAQTSSSNNVLGTTGVTGIQSTTSSYKLSVGGSIKQFGTGDNGTSSPTLYLRNTTSGTGRNWGINSGNGGLFQILDSNASNAIRLAINSSGYVGIGTTSLSEQLVIGGGGSGNEILIGSQIASGYNHICLNGSTNPNDYNFESKNTDKNLWINTPTGQVIVFSNNDVPKMAMTSTGRLGIGQGWDFNSVGYQLDVATPNANDGLNLKKVTGFWFRAHGAKQS